MPASWKAGPGLTYKQSNFCDFSNTQKAAEQSRGNSIRGKHAWIHKHLVTI